MLHNLVKIITDATLGNSYIRKAILQLFGYRWNGWMLGLFGYRAIHMVSSGEICVLAGIYNAKTIIDFSTIIGNSGKVLVIEANPQNAERLRQETKHLTNITITNRAVWNTSGKMEFICSLSDKDQGYNRLDSADLQKFPTHMDDSPHKVMVQTDTLTNILKEQGINHVDHINLTINGAELQALDSLIELGNSSPNVRIYINSETPDPALKLISELKDKGFQVFTSHMIRVINKKIKLVRIYAFN